MILNGIEFRELTGLCHRDYAISIDGRLWASKYVSLPIPTRGGYVNLKYSDSEHYAKVKIDWLVASVWYNGDLEEIKKSIFCPIILRARAYYSRPRKEIKNLPMTSPSGFTYAITADGDVWQTSLYKTLKPVVNKKGYLQVSIGTKVYDIHKLLALSFIKIPKELQDQGYNSETLHVTHINGNGADNRLENLMWCIPNTGRRAASYKKNKENKNDR